ncbi:hypothetical protein J4G08_00285 [Candidatus Poribacteria bacterium]|nr:hypothetical protein [Candidatus Poribacteria bacterium]
MRSQTFKTFALLLCLLILYMSFAPHILALEKCYGFWKCLGLKAATYAALAAAFVICGVPEPSIVGCVAAWYAYFFFADLYYYKCKKCKK